MTKLLFKRVSALLIMTAVVLCALAMKPAVANSTLNSVDIRANTVLIKPPSGELLQGCVLTVGVNTYPIELVSCKELGESVLQQLQRQYPLIAFNLYVDGYSYNTI